MAGADNLDNPMNTTPDLCFASNDGEVCYITIKKGETLIRFPLSEGQKQNIVEILIRSMR